MTGGPGPRTGIAKIVVGLLAVSAMLWLVYFGGMELVPATRSAAEAATFASASVVWVLGCLVVATWLEGRQARRARGSSRR